MTAVRAAAAAVALALLVLAGGASASTTAPALVLATPADGSATNDTTPQVAGTGGIAEGDLPTVRVQVRTGTGGGQPIRSFNAAVDPLTGAWSVTVEPELAEGIYNVRAEQSDSTGGSTESPRHVFTVDVTAPGAPALTGPAARTSSNAAEIGFTLADPGVTFLCRLDGGTQEACTSPASYSGLAEGSHAVEVRALDAAGNVGPASSHTWTVDRTPPSLSLGTPAAGTATNDTTPLVAGTGGTALGDVGTVQVLVRQGAAPSGAPIRTVPATVNPATGAWSVSVVPELAEGTYNVQAEQLDDVGNAALTASRAFTVDLTPPAAPGVSGPATRTRLTSASVTITHGEPGVTLLCRLDGGTEEQCTSPKVYNGLAQGGHVVAVRARDAAGNLGATASHAWTVDTTAPVVSLVTPANGSATNDSTPLVAGTGGTALGDATSVRVDVRQGSATTGTPFRSLTAPVNQTTGAWSVSVQPTLPEGTYTVLVHQSDDVGNEASGGPRTFAVDLSVPSVGLTAPANGTVMRQRSPTFTGTSDQASVTLQIFAGAPGGTPLHSATVPVTAGAWSLPLAAQLPDGVYTSLARATNAAGTSGSSNAATFVVDNGPPSFTSVPEDQTLEQTARAGEVVAYTATAQDALDQAPQVVCSPSSGSTFPRGSTKVTCTATDWSGFTAEASFTVTVRNTIAPEPVATFSARAGNKSVRLSWRRPTDWDHDRVVIRRAARGGSTWKIVLTTATASAFVDRTVTNEREYVYRATSVDLAGNVSPLATATARPSAFLAPAWGAEVPAPPLLRWAGVRRADYYNVQVWHRGRKILSRWPTVARYQLPASWKFAGRRHALKPGTYFAYAWPGYGPKARARYGPLIGSTKFVVN